MRWRCRRWSSPHPALSATLLPPVGEGRSSMPPAFPRLRGKVPEGRMGAVGRHNQLAADLGLAIPRPGVQARPARFPPPALHATSPASGRREAQRS
ncbi:hypothetical protein XAC3810_90189 [Xanthomonas citri pv. citri]|uniref:Uncharacterized protein n=1 Tax=Xanthomonas citri pv. citri TaxID=611301 RepID=A0A0U5FI01_XANCI|nr:hypothetical protein XAC3824_110191 [Xanthomonas citri pv. citri]CEE16745.1 hypothetical protein XAC1083_100187 [Xanthomonas citri pv. citri]CEE17728.1 hypothetical protein XAC902_100191 [Xanthomonas citri pv. citri]CEE22456.1 hypothetical protein XAC2911_100003 [Xanthomonas citri pv. citri]CEE28237.1 hypothetical protein XAC908_150029 [Xanthomonas citri pv. citri]